MADLEPSLPLEADAWVAPAAHEALGTIEDGGVRGMSPEVSEILWLEHKTRAQHQSQAAACCLLCGRG